MRSSINNLFTATLALTASVGLCLPAQAGKGGSGGGMSRSISSGAGRSMSAGPSMSTRAMSGGMSGMSARSMGGMSSGGFSNQARSMGGSSFNSRSPIGSAANRNVGGNVSRNVGGSSFGNARSPLGGLSNGVRNTPNGGSFQNRSPITTQPFGRGSVRDLGGAKVADAVGRGVVKDLGKSRLADAIGRGTARDLGNGKLGDFAKGRVGRDRMTDVLGGKLGSKDSPIVKGTGIVDSLKTGRIRTGDIAKIDRSKLRDLVKGIESGRGNASKGGVRGGLDKGLIADAMLGGGLRPFNPGKGFGGKAGGFKSGAAGIVAGGCFPSHKNHSGWFDFCFGGWGFDYCYDYPSYSYPCYDPCYYDYCWYPAYSYPVCGVTFAAYPEVATIAATQPILIEQTINLEISEEDSTAGPISEEPKFDVAADLDAAWAAATTDVALADAANGEPQAEETIVNPFADEPTTGVRSSEPVEQSEVDLELVDVEMVAAGNREANVGPSFKVTVRNAGKRDLENFLVSLVACKDAQIDSSSVYGGATVEQLAAGEETTVEVTLPVEALSLNRDSQGRTTPYNTLIAAVDSDERISEGNEENNLALMDRTSIKLASY